MSNPHWHVYMSLLNATGDRTGSPSRLATRHSSRKAGKQYRVRLTTKLLLPKSCYETWTERCDDSECEIGLTTATIDATQ